MQTITHAYPIAAQPPPPAQCADDPIWTKWAGRVALTQIAPSLVSPLTPRLGPVEKASGLVRYGKAFAIGGHDVLVKYDGETHRFDRSTGLCVESPWGLLGDWRIAPHEMPRYRGGSPAKYRKEIDAAKAAGKIVAGSVTESLVEKLFEDGEYGDLSDVLADLEAHAKVDDQAPAPKAAAKKKRAKR